MNKFVYSTWFVAMMFGCGGGGGGDTNEDLGEQIGLIEDLPVGALDDVRRTVAAAHGHGRNGQPREMLPHLTPPK